MAGIRPARSIRNIRKVAWTRFSRSKPRRSFIKAMPHKDLNVFRMGTPKKDYDLTLDLVAQDDLILRDNALEAARQSANKYLEKALVGNYYMIVRVFPHHVLRENKMIAGAGADRLQKGMRQSFGRPTDRAARLHKGTPVFSVHTYKANVETVQVSFRRARLKMSGGYKVVVAPKPGAA